MNFVTQELKNKSTSLKKYTNWAKLIHFSLNLREREEKDTKYFAPVMAVTTETLVGLRVTFRPEALMAMAAGKNNIWIIPGIFGFGFSGIKMIKELLVFFTQVMLKFPLIFSLDTNLWYFQSSKTEFSEKFRIGLNLKLLSSQGYLDSLNRS